MALSYASAVNVTFTYLVLRISRTGTRPSGRRREASEPKPGSAVGRLTARRNP